MDTDLFAQDEEVDGINRQLKLIADRRKAALLIGIPIKYLPRRRRDSIELALAKYERINK
jgi:hypothetical protein